MEEAAGLRAEAEALYARSDLAGALAKFQELLRVEPEDAETHNDAGTVCFALGRIEDSIRYYARALELDPDCAPAKQNLEMVAEFTRKSPDALLKQAGGSGSRPPLVTALLLNYRRPQNMQRVLDCLASQSVPVQVFLWNNGDPLEVRPGDGREPVPVEQHPLVRLVVTPSSNLRCWPRWLLGSMADTDYLCTLDDDLALADERVLEDAISASREKCPEGIVGFFGWERMPGKSYRKSRHVNGSDEDTWVDLIKGRFMLFPRVLLERVPLHHPVFRALPDTRGRADDVYVNVCISGGRRGAHLVPGALGKRYVELSECGVALRDEPGHREERDELVRHMFAAYDPLRDTHAGRAHARAAPQALAAPDRRSQPVGEQGEYTEQWYRDRARYREPYHAFARCIEEVFRPRSLVDLGCGAGYVLECFAGRMPVLGVEASPAAIKAQSAAARRATVLGDLTGPPLTGLDAYEFAVCIEVAEHIAADRVERFLEWFKHARRVLLTAAPPGQGGLNHVNEQPRQYWQEGLARLGFRFEREKTEQWRAAAAASTTRCPWVVRNAMYFERVELAAPRHDAGPVPVARSTGAAGGLEQVRLLRDTAWDALIILDACRADYFGEVAGDMQRVRSPANCTAHWIREVAPLLAKEDPIYFTANPIVDREMEKAGVPIELVSVWKDLWAHHTAWRIPSVHPLSVNGVVSGYRRLGRLKGRKVVVHYIQPHSPYIGSLPLAMARWGDAGPGSQTGDGLAGACARLPRPDVAAARGELDWTVLRNAYRTNLELVWQAARQLAGQLEGTVVITSDHGELLGEMGGQFGHQSEWKCAELFEVPWLVLQGAAAQEPNVQEKLAALGYV